MSNGRFRLTPSGAGVGNALKQAYEDAFNLEDDTEEVRRMRELLERMREMTGSDKKV